MCVAQQNIPHTIENSGVAEDNINKLQTGIRFLRKVWKKKKDNYSY